jgi:hypothetical protein
MSSLWNIEGNHNQRCKTMAMLSLVLHFIVTRDPYPARILFTMRHHRRSGSYETTSFNSSFRPSGHLFHRVYRNYWFRLVERHKGRRSNVNADLFTTNWPTTFLRTQWYMDNLWVQNSRITTHQPSVYHWLRWIGALEHNAQTVRCDIQVAMTAGPYQKLQGSYVEYRSWWEWKSQTSWNE